MHWLVGGFNNLQLDIVGFLAILGEASVLTNAQVSALSKFFLLPRLVPAPQALIRTTRPERLDSAPGKVFGVSSGSVRDSVQYIAHTLHNGSSLPDYAVRCEKIVEKTGNPINPVKAKTWGPLTFLSILGCSMSIAIFITSIVKGDGMALLAILLLSFLSTLVGIGSRWTPDIKERKATRAVPRSDVIIQFPQGAFLIVQCEESTARQLYWHPPRCEYSVNILTYRIISLVGTLMLMFGVICLGNATLLLQGLFAGAYLILNAAYWAVAALPQHLHWDLSHFRVIPIHYAGGEKSQTFTEALWKAIAISRSVEWVRAGQVAPGHGGWKEWLDEAEDHIFAAGEKQDSKLNGTPEHPFKLPEWDPEEALTRAMAPKATDNV